jgi:hypothetical protein
MNNFEKEYEVLRHELDGNRKYVFERPLVIITAAFVIFGYASDSDFIMLFPPVIVYLLLFNLKFTKNRLASSGRIVEYIKLFIEERNSDNFRWETFLENYRLTNPKEENGLRYYPIIYWFHIISSLLFLLLATLLYFENPIVISEKYSFSNLITALAIAMCIIGFVFLIVVGFSTRPKNTIEIRRKKKEAVVKALARMENKQ